MTPHARSDAEAAEHHTALIIGSGFGGQAAAWHLRRLGIEDFLILERRDWLGGTWMQNSYPGAAVDVPSPLYSLSFAPYDWTRMFADQAELLAYTEHVLDTQALRARARLGTEVTAARWDQASHCWQVETRGQGRFSARFLINASGPLSTPLIPDVPGLARFAGQAFHTNAWNHDCALAGKRVAIVGSGASAAQVIPAIATEVATLHVFQRTPHWVLPRQDHEFSRLERRLLSFPVLRKALRTALYWALEARVIGFKYSPLLLDHVVATAAKRHLAQQVADPALRAALTPDYRIGCKRIILSSTLYPALTRPNVRLHTRADGIREILPEGIATTLGEVLPVDVILFATGYDASEGALPYPVIGQDGRSLRDVWRDFPRAYLGSSVPGFPNYFQIMGPNTGIGHTSAIFMIESQMEYIRRAIAAVQQHGARSIEVCAEAEATYTSRIHRAMAGTVWQSGGCRSWYQSRSGHVVAIFPGFSFSFRRQARAFRASHHLLA